MMTRLKDISKATHIKDLTKEQLKELQHNLNLLGYNLKVDGIYGQNTLKAFNQFKKGNRLTHPNLIGKTTVDKLLELVTKVNRSSRKSPQQETQLLKGNYCLNYYQHYDRERGQDYGRLMLNYINGVNSKTMKIWIATSSHRSGQKKDSIHERGGLIPQNYRAKTLANSDGTFKAYMVNLASWHSNTRGIEGQFYHILPNQITTDKGGRRSEFGIHRDANIEGSMGCIVLSDDRFKDFHKIMQSLRSIVGDRIPLFVAYS